MACIVLDASVLIALWDDSDAHHAWALEFFNSTLTHDLAISALTHAEVMVRPIRNQMLALFDSGIRGLNLQVVPVTGTDSAEMASIRASHGLAMPDSVVVAAARRVEGALATCDRRLAKVARDLGLATFAPN